MIYSCRENRQISFGLWQTGRSSQIRVWSSGPKVEALIRSPTPDRLDSLASEKKNRLNLLNKVGGALLFAGGHIIYERMLVGDKILVELED